MSYKTESADVRFKASDGEGSTQSIGTLENGADTNTVLHSRLDFYLRLKPGVSFAQAQKIAEYLNEFVAQISVTFPT